MFTSEHDVLHDRRSALRHRMNLPLKHRVWKSTMQEQSANTVDISERGIAFLTDFFYSEGEAVELIFEIPEPVAGEPTSQWLCTGHVVTVRQIGTASKSRIGIQFDCCEVARQKDTTSVHSSTTSFSMRSLSAGR
jgi:hypothetical protein